jgi:uncharacterized damage-inducible protein DinB
MNNSPKRRPPERTEYDDFYDQYISLVPDGDIIDILATQLASSLELFSSIPEEKLNYRYAPGKWTTREVLGHIIDVERLFTFRALQFARGDPSPLPGMDQTRWMSGANFGQRSIQSFVVELRHLRAANTILFDSFDEEILDRTGTASNCRFTVRSILYIIVGHQFHHVEILKTRYL